MSLRPRVGNSEGNNDHIAECDWNMSFGSELVGGHMMGNKRYTQSVVSLEKLQDRQPLPQGWCQPENASCQAIAEEENELEHDAITGRSESDYTAVFDSISCVTRTVTRTSSS